MDFLKLTKQLFPTGRAWKLSYNSTFEKLIKGLVKSESTAYNFAISILDRILPDNENFTSEDATEWERRLGLPVGNGSLEFRKDIIFRKYQFPGSFLNRQNYRYLEAQLQLAGFPVTVTENTDPNYQPGVLFQHSMDTEMGDSTELGDFTVNLIANSYENGELYDISSPLGCFIISGAVPLSLITTFRKLVLTLKPVNTVAILNITTDDILFTYLNDGIIIEDGIYLID